VSAASVVPLRVVALQNLTSRAADKFPHALVQRIIKQKLSDLPAHDLRVPFGVIYTLSRINLSCSQGSPNRLYFFN